METNTTSFIDKAINGLRQAAVELEEFQLQLALGKAEASDKYEEIKKKFNRFIHDAKASLNEKAVSSGLKRKLEELQLQLELGKAETKDAFKEQKKKILKSLSEIEAILKTLPPGSEFYLKFNNELKKFRIKMEILQLRYELGKMDAKDSFEEKKKEFLKKANQIRDGLRSGEETLEKGWDHFYEGVNNVYSNLKKAFTL